MEKRMQITLTGNESKRLLARAALSYGPFGDALAQGKILLMGGSTVSALAELLALAPMRLSGQIRASGTRTARSTATAAHNYLYQQGKAIIADDNICAITEDLTPKDLIVVGANAIDNQGRAAIAFAAAEGGNRGLALRHAAKQGIPLLILAGLHKLIADVPAAVAACNRQAMIYSMGAAVDLYQLAGTLLEETAAFNLLYALKAIPVCGSGIIDGEGTVSFVLQGSEQGLKHCWQELCELKGAVLSANAHSTIPCAKGCPSCARHSGCAYKKGLLRENYGI